MHNLPLLKTESEFDRYDESVVSVVIRSHAMEEAKFALWADDSQRGKEAFIYDVLHGFANIYNGVSGRDDRKWLNPYSELQIVFADSQIQYLDDNDNVSTTSISDLLMPLSEAYSELIREYDDSMNNRITLKTVQRCVRAYFTLVQKTVFFKENSNLRNVQFRNSEYLNNLALPDYRNLLIKSDVSDIGYNVPFADAYCLQALLDIADRLGKRITGDDTKELRINMECTFADADFARYIYINGQSYRITMNRQTSKIVARPIYRRSSVMAVKPLRLFEKIAAFIANDCQNRIYKVVIIGHSERSILDLSAPSEKEVKDLCEMLSGWLKEQKALYGKSFMPTVEIEYQVNKADWYDCRGEGRFEEKNEPYQCGYHKNGGFTEKKSEIGGKETQFAVIGTIKPVDYEKQFAYSSQNLHEIIDNSDIVFLLEPSFLFFENFDIQRSYTLDYYCQKMHDYLEKGKKIVWAEDDSISDSVYGSMKSLSSQLNRIMASRSMDSGDICRVINKDYVNRIKKRVNEQKGNRKCVFIFSSETYGLDMSGMATYPLSRVEKYNQKKMTIFQFCNYTVPSLLDAHEKPKERESVHYKISLWSIFKYASIRYSFKEKDVWRTAGDGLDWLNNYDYFRILKSILVVVEAVPKGEGLFTVKATLTIKECFDKYLYNRFVEENIPKENRLNIAKKLYKRLPEHYEPLVRKLFEEVLFKWDSDESKANYKGLVEENNVMRTGFSMNLYSSAKNSRDMFFLYLYVRELSNGEKVGGSRILTDINPTVEVDRECVFARLEKNWKENRGMTLAEEKYFFMDKKLFMDIPDRLNHKGMLDMVGINLCHEANQPGVFQCRSRDRVDYFDDLADAFLDLCEWAEIPNDELKQRLIAWKQSH